MKFKNACYLIILACFPYVSFSQVVDDVIDEIRSIKSKNYNFYLERNTTELYGKYELEVDGLKEDVYGNVQTVIFKNIKGSKTLNSDDIQKILNNISYILEENEYAILASKPEDNTYVFQKLESEMTTHYFELYIPTFSNEYCEIIYTLGSNEITYLNDRSFEEYRSSTEEKSWQDCARDIFEGNSPPGIHYTDSYTYGFSHPASEGKQYISLIARDNKTWELLGQKLNYALKKDSCYRFSVDLRHEDEFESFTKSNKNEKQFYDTKLLLTVSLSEGLCYPDQVIYRSEAIWNTEWEKYEIQFIPTQDYNFIIFEANYANGQPGNGNIMMDNLSDIKSTTCKK